MKTAKTLRHLALVTAVFQTGTALAQDTAVSTFDARLQAELGAPGGLTSEQVARRALDTSFDVNARRGELMSAAADADRALLGYLPELSVSASYTRLSDLGESKLGNLVAAPGEPLGPLPADAQLVSVPLRFRSILNQYSLQANLLVPVSDYFLRVAPARSAAEHARLAAVASVETSQARVSTDARAAYYSWVRSRLSVAVAEQALQDARQHLSDAQVALAAGSAAPADVLRLESQVARSENLLVSMRTLAAVSEEQVRVALHQESPQALVIGEDVRNTPADRALQSQAARLPELLAQAYYNRPELKALAQNARGLSDRAQVDRAGYLPRLDGLASAAYANPNPRVFPAKEEFRGSWQAGVRLSWSLTEIPLARLRAKSSEARVAALESERSALMDRIRVEVRAAALAVDDSSVTLRTTQRGLESAEESYRARRLSFQNGRSTSVELLDAETDLTRARLERLNAEVDARVAVVRLNYAIGRALP